MKSNIIKSIKEDKLLKGKLLSGIPYIYSYVTVQQFMYSNINNRYITLMSLLSSVIVIFFNSKWTKKDGHEITKRIFIPLILIETISYGILVVYFLYSRNVICFYLLNSVMYMIITNNICTALYYIEEKRYKENISNFRVNLDSVSSILTILGYGLAFIIPPSINIAFICFYISTIADNYFQIVVFKDTYKES